MSATNYFDDNAPRYHCAIVAFPLEEATEEVVCLANLTESEINALYAVYNATNKLKGDGGTLYKVQKLCKVVQNRDYTFERLMTAAANGVCPTKTDRFGFPRGDPNAKPCEWCGEVHND